MKKVIPLLVIFLLIYVYINSANAQEIIPDEAIRFRVIANSNTIYDQNIKIQVRNVVQNKIFELLKGSEELDKTRTILKENEELIRELVSNTLKELGYDKDFKVNYGYNHFPEKKYKGIKYKEGMYESLVITLGDGNGDNWWCVLFPPLCLVEADETNITDAEYTFFIKELIQKYIRK